MAGRLSAQVVYQVFESATNELLYKDSTRTFENAQIRINAQISDWVKKGYLLANLDSTVLVDSQHYMFYLFKGIQYDEIFIDSLLTDEWEDVEMTRNLRKIVNSTISIEKFAVSINKLLQYYTENGYPFIHFKLVNPIIDAHKIKASLSIKKGNEVVYDTLSILSETNLSRHFVANYLGIKEGGLYNELNVKQIENKMNALPFLKLSYRPLISFKQNKAQIILKLEKQKVNKIDAIAGFAPQSTNNANKLLFTGQADIELYNVAGGAEKFTLFWQSFLKNSQSLKAGLSLPYLPYLSFGTDLGFELLKFDSNFLTTKSSIALTYRNSNNTKFYSYYRNEQTSLLSLDTNGIRANFSFPSPNATKLRQYGLGIEKQQWSNFFNPYKGFSINFEGGLGRKSIEKDNRVESIRFGEGTKNYTLYDSFKLNFTQANFIFKGSLASPLKGVKLVLFSSVETQAIVSEKVYLNELFRLGGFKSLRGFDEQAIFANKYVLGNVELRYRYDNLSNVFIFGNAMYYVNESENFAGVKEDIPYGFGLGANINTGNTILSVAYAYGIQKNIPLNIARGKFHFGLVSYF